MTVDHLQGCVHYSNIGAVERRHSHVAGRGQHPRWNTGLWAAVLTAALASAGCAAIRRFDVTPHEICPGTTVKTDWDVTGHATVKTEPELVPQSDQIYAPISNTDFLITAHTPLKTARAPAARVTVYSLNAASPEQPLTFNAKCIGNTVVAEDVLVPGDWDPRLILETLTSGEDREITVAHAGKEATFTVMNRTSSNFAGTQLIGRWKITVPLLSTETCTGGNPPTGLDQIIFIPVLSCRS